MRAALRRAILSALSEKDETADICRDKDGEPEPDSDLRDYEYVPLEAKEQYWDNPLRYERVPLKETVDDYFEREVKPYLPDAWVSEEDRYRDDQDGEIGRVGYEINFNRYFYEYEPPRPLPEIEADLRTLEEEILSMLREVTE